MYTKQMLKTYPRDLNVDADALANCIDACLECAQACHACADACLSEETVGELVKCIRLNLDCGDICATTATVLSRQTEYDAEVSGRLVEACRQACSSSGDECEQHAEHHEHCRVCAEACRQCRDACEKLLAAMK